MGMETFESNIILIKYIIGYRETSRRYLLKYSLEMEWPFKTILKYVFPLMQENLLTIQI